MKGAFSAGDCKEFRSSHVSIVDMGAESSGGQGSRPFTREISGVRPHKLEYSSYFFLDTY